MLVCMNYPLFADARAILIRRFRRNWTRWPNLLTLRHLTAQSKSLLEQFILHARVRRARIYDGE